MDLMILFWLLLSVISFYVPAADANCIAMQEFLSASTSQKLVKLDKDYYRIGDNGKHVYVNDEPITFWLQLNDDGTLPTFLFMNAWSPSRAPVNVFIEPYGKYDCLLFFQSTVQSPVIDLSTCTPCQPLVQQDGKKYVPLKIWTENEPIIFETDAVYVFEEEKAKMTDTDCPNKEFLQINYGQHDYADLLTIYGSPSGNFETKNEKRYINLRNSLTVVWIKIEDSSPEHYLLIELADSQMIQNTFEIQLEANGRDPRTVTEILSNGFKINLKNVLCVPDYKFLGYIRYIIAVNEAGALKASFYDVKSNKNLKLYHLLEESYGTPEVDPDLTNNTKIAVPFTTTTTTTTTAAPTEPSTPSEATSPTEATSTTEATLPTKSEETIVTEGPATKQGTPKNGKRDGNITTITERVPMVSDEMVPYLLLGIFVVVLGSAILLFILSWIYSLF